MSETLWKETFDRFHGRYRADVAFVNRSHQPVRVDVTGIVDGRKHNVRAPRSRGKLHLDAMSRCRNFEKTCWLVLSRDSWAGRRRLFEMCFIGTMSHGEATRKLVIPEGTADYWRQEIKKVCGRALLLKGEPGK